MNTNNSGSITSPNSTKITPPSECITFPGNWLYAVSAKDFISLAKKDNGGAIEKTLFQRSIDVLKTEPSSGERYSWKHSLPALADVLQEARMSDQLVILEYCPPSRDKNPSRIDAVICGVDKNNNIHAVLIELKQWSNNMYEATGDFLLVHIAGELRPKIHPRKQIEEYRAHMRKVLSICNEPPTFITFAAYAYLHNAAHLTPHVKHLLFSKGQFEEDSRLYTKEFGFALANRLRELVGGGKGDVAFKALRELQIKAIKNVKLLPKRPNYKWLKLKKRILMALWRYLKIIFQIFLFLLAAFGFVGGLLWIAFTL